MDAPPEVAALLDDPKNRLGPYVLVQPVGKGGMGEVHKAWSGTAGGWVALKLLKNVDEESITRFQREAEVARPLDHPGIARVLELGRADGRPYLAMQFVDGTTIEECGDLPKAVAAVRDAARALAYAHEKGVVHRDVTPRNIMIDRSGRGVVTDFGLARTIAVGATLTKTGVVLGTPAYLSPEQAAGARTDARTDIYGLGAVLYFLCTRSAPFYGDDALQVMEKVRTQDPPRVRDLVPAVDPALGAIIGVAMQKRPEDRYPSASALADDLDRHLAGQAIHARPPSVITRAIRRITWPWAVAGVVILGLAGALAALALRPEPKRPWREIATERLAPVRGRIDRFKAEVRPGPDLVARYETEISKVTAQLLKEFPQFSDALVEQGRFLTEAGRFEAAAEALDRAVPLEPEAGAPGLHRGRLRMRQYVRGRVRLLAEAVNRAVRLPLWKNPDVEDSPELKRMREGAREDLGRFGARADAAGPSVDYVRGVLAVLDGNWEGSIAPLERAAASVEVGEDALALLAVAHAMSGRYESIDPCLARIPAHRDVVLEARLWIVLHLMIQFRSLDLPLKQRPEVTRTLWAHGQKIVEAEDHPLLQDLPSFLRWLRDRR